MGGPMIRDRLRRMAARVRRRVADSFARVTRSRAPASDDVENYWTAHNVTEHRIFKSAEASLDDFHWRNAQYFRYIDLMPVSHADGLRILDFGCGPGYDLVGFATQSKPARLVGVDVSRSSLDEASRRLALHGAAVELLRHDVNAAPLPFEDGSFDLVHASGVLHHTPDARLALRELRRVAKTGAIAQIMVYNRASLWVHLYVAYLRQIVEGLGAGDDLAEAFRASTDGPDCPISRAYTPEQFAGLAEEAGFALESYGVGVSAFEMSLLPRRFEAIMHQKLRAESRDFLAGLTFDSRGLPLSGGVHAGIDGCYRFRAA
jgi:ubiquinone/menaquinone biosynthesis C-methylase UbiE